MTSKNQLMGLKASCILLRIALAASFLSAVADRFGLWGAPGAKGVAWGDFASFEGYTALLNWYLPAAMIPFVAWAATLLEVILGVFLLIGVQLKRSALASGCLLSLFFISMTIAVGVKAPLDYSVLSAAAGAFLLGFSSER